MEQVREYFPNDKVKAEGTLLDEKKHDAWTYYYENGNKYRQIIYNRGIENGSWIMWHENGHLYLESNKINGKTLGTWKEYYENGSLKEVGEYSDNEYFPKDYWDEDGNQLLKVGNGMKIEKFGAGGIDVFEHHFEHGKLVKEVRL